MGHGLLEELSLFELREKLENQKRLVEEETERKRLENVKKKDEKALDLQEKLKDIKALRSEKERTNQDKRNEKLKIAEEDKKRQQDLREKTLLEVHSKIMKKKNDKNDELDRISKELREIKLKRQYLNADKVNLII